jgi:hypothetical protein
MQVIMEKQQRIEALLAEQQKTLSQILDGVRATAQSVNELVSLLRSGQAQAPSLPEVPLGVVPLPLMPQTLLRVLQLFGPPGEVTFGGLDVSFTVPLWPPSVHLVIPVQEGHVGMFLSNIRVISDPYSEGLTVYIYVDDPRYPVFKAEQMVEATEGYQGQNYVIRNAVHIVAINSTTDTTFSVTVRAEGVDMQKSLYDEWLYPLMQYSWSALNRIVASVGGKPR